MGMAYLICHTSIQSIGNVFNELQPSSNEIAQHYAFVYCCANNCKRLSERLLCLVSGGILGGREGRGGNFDTVSSLPHILTPQKDISTACVIIHLFWNFPNRVKGQSYYILYCKLSMPNWIIGLSKFNERQSSELIAVTHNVDRDVVGYPWPYGLLCYFFYY